MMLNDGNYDENENFKMVNVMCKDELGTPPPPPLTSAARLNWTVFSEVTHLQSFR